jgi:hypothetical protein
MSLRNDGNKMSYWEYFSTTTADESKIKVKKTAGNKKKNSRGAKSSEKRIQKKNKSK